MPNVKINMGAVIKARREMLGLLQPELAAIARVSTRTLQLVEKGKANASIETLLQIADPLGLTIELRLKDMDKSAKPL
ncbi:MAG: helix-turn-helix transcriptional regulator [Chitinophagaceae bacterium]|jgi:DNA-binding XRE family transcriptional regulator|nr:helix-turn-helix transcriptional regulator [Chitinophagaceae bacterium]